MSEKLHNSFLGRGWSFPPTFDRDLRSVTLVEDEVDIQQSLHILFSTSLGERIMRPDYGCNLRDFQFEPTNNTFLSYLEDLIENAILFHEPRIALDNIDISRPDDMDLIEGRLRILLEYSIPGVNSRFNYVYDFYLNEANESISNP